LESNITFGQGKSHVGINNKVKNSPFKK